MPDFFIGFPQLDEFIAATDGLFHDIYVSHLQIIQSNDWVDMVTSYVVASQVKGDHLIYCLIPAARWQETCGKPFGPTSFDNAQRAPRLQERLWQFVVERFRADNPDLEIFDGVPTFPRDLLLVPGSIAGVIYSDDLQDFVKEGVA